MPSPDRYSTSILDRYTQRARRADTKPFTDESQRWFLDKVADIKRSPSRRKLLSDESVRQAQRRYIGKMYMFFYDPKTKADLPYYDRFPLIILADRPKKGKGFFGLNLHYLRPRDRAVFLDKLYDTYATNNKLDTTTRIKISYGLLKGAARLRAFKPTFKRYLPGHIRGSIAEVPADQWETAIFLPTQSFQKESATAVWRYSASRYFWNV